MMWGRSCIDALNYHSEWHRELCDEHCRSDSDSAHLDCRELCNECHTDDNYEVNNNIQPGSLVYNWEVQQAAFLKHTIGVKQVPY